MDIGAWELLYDSLSWVKEMSTLRNTAFTVLNEIDPPDVVNYLCA